MGYEQHMALFSYVHSRFSLVPRPFAAANKMAAGGRVWVRDYSRLPLGTLPSSIHQKKPIHGLKLFFATAVWLVSPKRANTLR